MISFFRDMGDNPFLATGLIAGFLASISCGVVGPYVVVRRVVSLTGAIAHMALGGVGASIFLSYRFPDLFGGLDPLYGATVSAVLAAILMAWVSHRARARLDTLIGALWAVGMSIGVLLVKYTPGYQTELMSYLFGNLALVSPSDLRLLLGLCVVVVTTILIYHKRLLAIAVDPEQAELQGIDVARTNGVLLVLVALTVIAVTRVVGLILVIALVSLPAATASRFAPRLSGVILRSIAISIAVTTVPRIAVYGTRIAPEPAIVLTAAAIYLLALAATRRGPRSDRARSIESLD